MWDALADGIVKQEVLQAQEFTPNLHQISYQWQNNRILCIVLF